MLTVSTVSTVVGIIGPAVGGALTAAIGGAWILALDSASYAVGAVLLLHVSWTQPDRRVRRGIPAPPLPPGSSHSSAGRP